MNLIFGVTALIAFILVGKKYAEKYRRKRKFYESFYLFSVDALLNIGYKKDAVKTLILKGYPSEDFSDAICENSFSGESSIRLPGYLSDEDKRFFSEYFSNIGKNVGRSEREYLEFSHEIIKEKYEKCKSEDEKYSALGVKLGFAFGAIVFILVL